MVGVRDNRDMKLNPTLVKLNCAIDFAQLQINNFRQYHTQIAKRNELKIAVEVN